MINWPLVLEFVKIGKDLIASLAWPVAAGLVAVRFREPISNAIGRTRRFSAFGIEAELPDNPQLTDLSAPTTSITTQLSVAPNPPDDEILSPLDAQLASSINAEPLSESQKLAWATRLASVFQLLALQERRYRLIFGSQIAFLAWLNPVGASPLSDAKGFFESHRDPDQKSPVYNFDAWLAFLENNGLVHIDRSMSEPKVVMTPQGRAFLTWMVQNGVRADKAL